MTKNATERTASGRAKQPPIYHVSGTAQMRDGDHTHDTWHVRVVHAEAGNQSLPMIVKRIPSQVTAAIEIACGLAARELRFNVPMTGLVVAERDDLPGLEDEVTGERFLLVGSHYQHPDTLFAEVVNGNPAAESLIWDSLCATNVARQGVAWDELIANPDRHCENVLFDGTTWWLFDHDQALEPAAKFVGNSESQTTRLDAIAFNAAENQLAEHLTRRYAGQFQAIMDQIKRLDSGGKRLQTLAHYARDWTHPDAEIHYVLQLIGVVLGLIHLRLPALAEKLQRRLVPGQAAPTPWTSPKRKP